MARFPTRSELYHWIRQIAAQEDHDVGSKIVRQPGVAKGIIPAAYVSGNPPVQQFWESSTTLGSKLHRIIQAYGNRLSAPAASDSISIGSDPDGNKVVLGKLVSVGSAVVDADYIMGLRPVAPGNTLLLTANNEQSTTSATFVTVKRFFVTRPGKYRIKLELARTGGTAEARVAIERSDGTVLVASSTVTQTTLTYPTFGTQQTLDMTVNAFWGCFVLIQLDNTSGPAQTAYVQNCTVSYQDATLALGSTDAVITD